MSEKVLLKKLQSVGNPFVLLKMMNDARLFVKQHQVDFPKNDDKAIYIQLDDEFYKFEHNMIEGSPRITAGNYIFILKNALEKLKVSLELDSDASLTDVLSALRKIKNLKKYKVLFEAVDKEFKTNIQMSDLVEIAIKLSKKK